MKSLICSTFIVVSLGLGLNACQDRVTKTAVSGDGTEFENSGLEESGSEREPVERGISREGFGNSAVTFALEESLTVVSTEIARESDPEMREALLSVREQLEGMKAEFETVVEEIQSAGNGAEEDD